LSEHSPGDNYWWHNCLELRRRAQLLCAITTTVALVCAGALWWLHRQPLLLPWLGLLCLSAVGYLGMFYLPTSPAVAHTRPPPGWGLGLLALVLLHGSLWGAGGAMLLHAHAGEVPGLQAGAALPRFGITLVLAAVTLTGGLCLAPQLALSLPFLLSATLPPALALMLALGGDTLDVVSILCLFLLLALVAVMSLYTYLRQNWQGITVAPAEYVEQLRHTLQSYRNDNATLRQQVEVSEQQAERLVALSYEDALTGISNRRHFDNALGREWRRAIRSREPVALIMIDIDDFKPYNDHLGHPAGDACLQQVAGVLRHHTRRGGDLAARYGGEEFAVLLPGAGMEAACIIAERIREGVEQLRIEHPAAKAAPVVTVSLGVAALVPMAGSDQQQLVQRADAALYRAKADGKNRLSHNNRPVASPE